MPGHRGLEVEIVAVLYGSQALLRDLERERSVANRESQFLPRLLASVPQRCPAHEVCRFRIAELAEGVLAQGLSNRLPEHAGHHPDLVVREDARSAE